MAGNGTATTAAAAKKGTASSKDGAGNGTTAAAAAKKSFASSKDGATAAAKDGWQRLMVLLLLPKMAGKGFVVASKRRHT